MTPESFATWLRGFMDAIEGVPTPAQVERIRAELAKVQSVEAAPVETKPAAQEPVDWQKFWQEWQKVMPPQPVIPSYPYPWDTQPLWPTTIPGTAPMWPDWYKVICGDRIVCGGGIPQSYDLTLTTDGVVHWPGGWATNAPGTDSVQ